MNVLIGVMLFLVMLAGGFLAIADITVGGVRKTNKLPNIVGLLASLLCAFGLGML